MSSIPNRKYEFLLVHFPNDPKPSTAFDIVPEFWIEKNDEGILCVRFIGENASSREMRVLQSLVQQQKPPLAKWEEFPVEIRGGEDTYVAAKRSLKRLISEAYAFSTEDEEHAAAKARHLEKQYLEKRVIRDQNKIDSLFTQAVSHDSSTGKINEIIEETPTSSGKGTHIETPITPELTPLQKPSGIRRKREGSLEREDMNNNSDPIDRNTKKPRMTPEVNASLNASQSPPDIPRIRSVSTESVTPIMLMQMFRLMQTSMNQMRSELISLKEAINDMKKVTSEQNKESTGRSRTKLVKLKEFLCTTLDNFDNFEERLKNDAEFAELISQGISHVINAQEMTPTRMITGVLRLLIHKNVLEHFTAKKITKEKRVFKDTKLWACICEEIATDCKLYSIPVIKVSDLESALGHTINNSKDWGTKKKRNKQGGPTVDDMETV